MPLQHRRIPRVALIIESKREYGRRILDGIARYLQENEPWEIFIEPRSLHDPAPQWLTDWQGDGIIARIMDDHALNQVKQKGIPLVNLKGIVSDAVNPPDFSVNRFSIGQMAAAHLMERQFRNFAFAGFRDTRWSELIFEGFSQTLKEHGFECDTFHNTLQFTDSYREVAMEREIDVTAEWLRTLPAPVGIVAADDYLGIQLLSACHKIGRKVPDQAAVLGLGDDATLCRLTSPTLSSLRYNEELLGFKAAELLDRRMHGDTTPHFPEKIEPLGITVRHSTDVTAIQDPLVRDALGWIRENVTRDIRLDDLVRHLEISKSTLERRFRKVLKRSVYDTILDWRMRHVMELLSGTDMPIKKIAHVSGFRHLEHLNNLFKQRIGVSPSQFRSQTK
ncbi:MAG: XylR family transcriptional regulator [Planctomycetia bacterium]|nr:XylR family transcriptional regulator [Planctomycetia bacterium]